MNILSIKPGHLEHLRPEALACTSRILQRVEAELMGEGRKVLAEGCMKALVVQGIAVSRATTALRSLAGGASGGKQWSESFEVGTDVLQFFQKTLGGLDKASICNIDTKINNLSQARFALIT